MLSRISTFATHSSSLRKPSRSTALKPRSSVRETVTSDVAMTSTETSNLLKTWNTWARKPCCPNMRVLLMTIIVMSRLLLIAATRLSRLSTSAISATMRVPGSCGLMELRTLMGTLANHAGRMAAGCTTLAPKVDSSAASSKVSTPTGRAAGTTRGSVVMTPLTSFQICTSEARSAAPITVAERSEPSRPSVVMVPWASFAT
mmetsp:Transcript_101055/g.253427  ORF Transcript_101055/g.253427 Transcript_101055/m.253427 type:complete len:202 (-) Transcript_101055:882-1487(-)